MNASPCRSRRTTLPFALFAALMLPVLLHAGGCGPPPPLWLRTTKMQIGTKPFTVEVADTDQTRAVGLMKRDSMPDDHGMIFVFKSEAPRAFYMKNTRFALDIIFLDANGKIVSFKQMKPYDLTEVPSDAPAKYAIEMNEGIFSSTGTKVGDKVDIPADASDAKE